MRRVILPTGLASIHAVHWAWPYDRQRSQRMVATPRHDRLQAALHPTSGYLPASFLPIITWADIAHLMKG